MLWAAAAYAAGLFAGLYLWRPPTWWTVAGTVFAGSAIYLRRRHWSVAFSLALSALFVLGALTVQVDGPETAANSDLPAFAEQDDVIVTAHVIREGNLQRK